ncbi:hypothetical protein WBP06_09450 [Novosphingobium sp. BL-8H]|uniref:hypothetical protein n=1 Tax=Novosphingobium sp. BL-8H TaxID=3127640 RepID=UPI003757C514
MGRIFSFIALAAITAVVFASNAIAAAISRTFDLIPTFARADDFRFVSDHPRSIFETRRAGLA